MRAADRENAPVKGHHSAPKAQATHPGGTPCRIRAEPIQIQASACSTAAAIRSCAELLKPDAPLLLYLYYAFDNRPRWFRWLWRLSNAARLLIRRLPP